MTQDDAPPKRKAPKKTQKNSKARNVEQRNYMRHWQKWVDEMHRKREGK